jgi:3-hydroxybutyryl-CoA dehydratase
MEIDTAEQHTPIALAGRAARKIDQKLMIEYTDTLGFRNPVHYNGNFAAKTEFGGPIASGPFALALLDDLMLSAFPSSWLRSGTLNVAFVAPVRPDDSIKAEVKLVSAEPVTQGTVLTFDARCLNQAEVVVMAGTVSVVCS